MGRKRKNHDWQNKQVNLVQSRWAIHTEEIRSTRIKEGECFITESEYKDQNCGALFLIVQFL
jgi:hypothetical protein